MLLLDLESMLSWMLTSVLFFELWSAIIFDLLNITFLYLYVLNLTT
uniref:Uncharacterized protein n=1 Tax=Arundo donax TaxID=35708 RepID=A0A0A8XW04_ARUDO